MLIELKLNELKLIELKLNEFSTWFLAVFAALLDGLEIIFVAFASAVNEFLAGSGRNVVKVAGEKGPAVARLSRLAAAIGALEPLALAVDEGHLAVVARIGHTDGVRVERAAGVEALVPADGWLDARVGTDGTQGPLLQDGPVGRAADRSAVEGVVDGLAGRVHAPAELALALLPGIVALQGADGRRDGHHQRAGTVFCFVNLKQNSI